jgi:hypothetical protein
VHQGGVALYVREQRGAHPGGCIGDEAHLVRRLEAIERLQEAEAALADDELLEGEAVAAEAMREREDVA